MIWKSLLALVLGFFGGWWVSAGVGFRYFEAANVFDRDGGASMGLFFIVAPFFGAIIAVALAAVTVARERAKAKRAAAGLPPEPASAAYRIARGIVTAAATYFAVWLAIEFYGPFQLSDTARMAVSDGIPLLIALAAGYWAYARR